MRILQVMAGGEHGGAETAFVDMCCALHEHGLTVEVATRPNDVRVTRLKDAGLTVHELPFGGFFDFKTTRRLKQIIKDFEPDIVQSWMSRGSAKTPRWDSQSGVKPYTVVARLGGYYKLKYFKSADYFTTITPLIKDYLVQNGIEPDRVRHINNFAETESVVTPIDRAAFDTPKDAPLALGLGRLHKAKAFDTLIKAIKKVPEAYLWIAGEGPDRPELEALIKQLGLTDRVKLLGWRSDRAALFRASDLCVFSSRYEPFGTVFVQSWAQKTPLVTTTADGPRQFVRHEEDGLIVLIDDVTRMAAAIKLVIEDKALQSRLVENGYQRYLNEFTKERCVKTYLAFYEEVLSKLKNPLP